MLRKISPTLITAVGASALMMLSPKSGFAADQYVDYEPDIQVVETTPVEFGTGWYIRGNIGVGVSNLDDPEVAFPSSFSVGAGGLVGRNIRADVTFERFGNASQSGINSDYDCGRGIAAENCYYEGSADITANGIMLNAYYDIPISSVIKPYVGAGIGAASVEFKDVDLIGYCAGSVVGNCGGGGVGPTVERTGDGEGDSYIAAMANIQAGFTYSVTQNLHLDAGYRFTAIQGGSVEDSSNGSGDIDTDFFQVHEVRVGFRYEIW